MDRTLLEMERAWEQTIQSMRRDINELRARVGSAAVVVGSTEVVDASVLGTDTGAQPTLLSVEAQPGRWVAIASVHMVGSVVDTESWHFSCHLSDRATGIGFDPAEGDRLPYADITHPVDAAFTGITLSSVGWVAVEPSDHPDGFIISVRLGVVVAAEFPEVNRVRLALLPF